MTYGMCVFSETYIISDFRDHFFDNKARRRAMGKPLYANLRHPDEVPTCASSVREHFRVRGDKMLPSKLLGIEWKQR